jgi:hypothetical protein
MLNRTFSILLVVQVVFCVLSAGFSPAIWIAFTLTIAAPICFHRAMEARGFMFLLFPCLTGMLLFQGLILSPVFLGWIAVIAVASAICWNRGPGKPRFYGDV